MSILNLFSFLREEDFLALPLNTPPELQRTDLSLAVLQLKALGIDNIVRLALNLIHTFIHRSHVFKSILSCLSLCLDRSMEVYLADLFRN